MDFTHSDDRRMLADSLARLIADRFPFEERTRVAFGADGRSAALWRDLTGLGAVQALFDEAAGGFGGGGFDIMVVFEAIGAGLVTEPVLEALVAGRALAGADGHDAVLARILAGEAVVAPALEEADSRYDPDTVAARATPDGEGAGGGESGGAGDGGGGGWVLDAHKMVVPHAESAAHFLVSARIGDDAAASLLLVPADADGVAVRGYANIDGGRSGEVTFARVRLGPGALVGARGGAAARLRPALDAAHVALCAEAVAIMDRIKAMTVDYLRTRRQFGVPIGSFQALQHRMAALLIEIEQARSATIAAAAALDGEDSTRRAAAAKHTIGEVGRLVTEEAIQLHGGIGMTWELPLSHHAKRLTMIDHQYGDADHHLTRYIALSAAAEEG